MKDLAFFPKHKQHRLIAFIHDVLMIPAAWFLSYWLRFNLQLIPEKFLQTAIHVLPVVILVQALAYWLFGLYRGIWRFASVPDLIRIIKAVLAASVVTAVMLFFYSRLEGVPRSVFPLYGLLLISFLGGSRLLYRWLKNQFKNAGDAKVVLIVGAGQAGEGLVRDLLRDSNHKHKPVAFVDDDSQKHGREIHGIRVLDSFEKIPEIVKQYQVDLIMIALPSASSKLMRRVVNYCEISGVSFCTLPSLNDLAEGRVNINSLRKVSIEDLLGREPVSLDWQEINATIAGKIILVSGGGGSIGAELCRQVAKLRPSVLVVIEQSEFNLYSLELELQQKFPQLKFYGYLGDVFDRVAVTEIFSRHHPEIVFHAAAYKHVPILESQLRVAIRNNILGTRSLAETAVAHHVKKFVLISTDKAVNPANIMGATKRIAEIFCQSLSEQSSTSFITVRFGNVLDSAGSVVPLFRKQIADGGPVTVTHPEITRFFMTIPEAAQLILQATMMGRGNEIFVLDMGEPIKIAYLAEQMIKLSGLKFGEDIEVKYTGLRPGEKLYEELFHEDENLINTAHHKILQARYRSFNWLALLQTLDVMATACDSSDELALQRCLFSLVPEYQGIKLTQVEEDVVCKENSLLADSN